MKRDKEQRKDNGINVELSTISALTLTPSPINRKMTANSEKTTALTLTPSPNNSKMTANSGKTTALTLTLTPNPNP